MLRVLVATIACWLAFNDASVAQEAAHSERMRLVILGTGTPNADPERSGPALAIVKGEHTLLFDAGPGIVRRAAAAAQRHIIEALNPPHLDTVFLTHLHSDHTLGLPDLMLSPWVLERTTPLAVYGPSGTRRMVSRIQDAYREDIQMRLHGGEPSNRTGWRSDVTEIRDAGVVYDRDGLRVEAIPVLHGGWRHAYGYRVTDGQTTIVISGDTRVSPALIEAARGADILVHEVYSTHRFATRPPEWQRYHASFHTSTQGLAQIGNEARPGLIVLYHQLYWGATDEDLLAEMREFGYAGRVVSARDLDVF